VIIRLSVEEAEEAAMQTVSCVAFHAGPIYPAVEYRMARIEVDADSDVSGRVDPWAPDPHLEYRGD